MVSKSNIIITDDPSHLAMVAANAFAAAARYSVNTRGRFVAAVSGGSTPRGMFRILAEEPYVLEIPWDKMHIFWVDERCVPENDAASNYGAAKKDFLNRVPIPKTQVYPMPGRLPPKTGAQTYQKALMAFFHLKCGQFPTFDKIFLGMGDDGHIASLFPGHSATDEEKKLVVAVKGGDPYVSRLTMTLPVLNGSRQIIFLISGKAKAAAVKMVFEGDQAPLPAKKIHALDGDVTWLLDREAASLLPGETIGA